MTINIDENKDNDRDPTLLYSLESLHYTRVDIPSASRPFQMPTLKPTFAKNIKITVAKSSYTTIEKAILGDDKSDTLTTKA